MKPKIRLKGFSGEWEETTFDKSVTINSGMDYKHLAEGNIPVYGTGGYMLSVNESLSDVDAIGIGRKGTIDKPQLLKAPFWTVDTLFFMTPKNGNDLNFLYALSQKINWRKYDESTGVPSLSKLNIGKIEFAKPERKEQHAIASYFQHLDSLIQSTTKKIESLKQVKAASLLSMFPQEGETTPRVRFKGFEGEWEKVQFSELYEPSSIKNKTFGADKIISVANMYFKPVSYISDEEYLKSYNVMNLGDIAFEGNKSKDYAHGRFVENTIGDGIVSHVFIVLKPISKQYDLQFWKYLINYERIMGPILLRSTKHSTMMTDLVVSDFLKESVLVPSYEEQIEIGKILSSLDRQITLHTQRLEKLKQIKTACLDEMFV